MCNYLKTMLLQTHRRVTGDDSGSCIRSQKTCRGGTNKIRRSGSTIHGSNYCSSTKQYLQRRCKTYEQNQLYGKVVDSDKNLYQSTRCSPGFTNSIIDIYVSAGDMSSPYYIFYTDSDGTQQLPGNTLYLNRSYRFQRLNDATSHAFYISDAGYGNASSTITLSGDGTSNNGISGSQSFTLNFNGLTNTDTLTFYCTVHSNMVGTFNLVSNDGYVANDGTKCIQVKKSNFFKTIKCICIITNSKEKESSYYKQWRFI